MDERDEGIVRLYRRSSREEPPAQADLAVLDMARRATRRRAWSPFGKHRLATGAVAAVALVSVVLVVLMQEPSGPTVLPDAALEQELDDGSVRLPLPPPGGRRDADAVVAGQPPASTKQAPAAQPPGASGPPQPRFDFYKTLPEMEVDVPPPEQPAVAVTLPPSPPAERVAAPAPGGVTPPGVRSQTPADTGDAPAPAITAAPSAEPVAGDAASLPPTAPAAGYSLQVGAFRAADSAARLKGRLEALKLPASIEAIELANRETWHRVRVGPYPDPSAAEAVRSRLQTQGIDSMLVKTAE